MTARRARVCIVQHRLLHYRVELFERLREACAARGMALELVHGGPTPSEASRRDTGRLAWATEVRNRVWTVAGKDLLWQPLADAVRGCDLLVLMQENRLLSNYPWLFGPRPASMRLAFWGHGRNFQSRAANGLREGWKRYCLNRVDWWFAYTAVTAEALSEAGFPAERVTVLNNAIDNSQFARDLAAVTDATVARLRRSVGAADGEVLGLYCGSLYADKRLDMLVNAGRLVHARRPGFRLVVLGDGPSRDVLQAVSGEGWLHWLGATHGADKAAWFRAAQLYLSPGAVGLHVLDSFVAGTPMVTTADALHGPEIAYLEHPVNGLITEGDASSYAEAVLELADHPSTVAALRAAGMRAATHYSLDAMVERFAAGLSACLDAPRLR